MTYLRTFYTQDGDFEATFSINNFTAKGPAYFGLSGTNVFKLDVSGDFVSSSGVLFSSINDDSVSFKICGSGGNVTVWEDGEPHLVQFPSGFRFNSVFAEYPSGVLFSESLLGNQPVLANSFSGWNTSAKSGNIILTNSGKYPLALSSFYLDNSVIQPVFSPLTLNSGASTVVPIVYTSNAPYSGTGNIFIESNAGDYNLSQYFNVDFAQSGSLISIYLKNEFDYPSGSSNFTIQNRGNQDATVNIFLDFFEKESFQYQSGVTTYPSGTGFVSYQNSGGGFFMKTLGSGKFNVQAGSNQTIFFVSYTGNFTGNGGRLAGRSVQINSGSANILLTGATSGTNQYFAFEDVYVYEGNGNHFDLWSMDYNDVDRGLENFKSLSRYTSSGLGKTGITYRIPSGSTTTGQIRYLSDYSNPIFQSLIFRVTDNNSVNQTLYIDS